VLTVLLRFSDSGYPFGNFKLYFLHNTTRKTKCRVTRTPLTTGCEFRRSGMVSNSCSTSCTLCIPGDMPWTRKGPCCSFFSLVYCGNTVFDIPELVVPIMICLVEGCCQQGTKGSQWLGLSDHSSRNKWHHYWPNVKTNTTPWCLHLFDFYVFFTLISGWSNKFPCGRIFLWCPLAPWCPKHVLILPKG
jgi:hypothetical protein